MPKISVWCFPCKQKNEIESPTITKIGSRHRLTANCTVCKKKVTCFVKNDQVEEEKEEVDHQEVHLDLNNKFNEKNQLQN